MFRKLLVPLDGSGLAEQALPVAASIARACGAGIDLVCARPSAVHSSEDDTYLQSIAAELGASPGLSVTCAAPEGNPIEVIVQRARAVDAELIVLTSHGRGGFGRLWMGSVADGVVRASRTPVLIARPSSRGPRRGEQLPLFQHVLIPLDGSRLSSAALLAAAQIAACSDAGIDLLRVVRPVPAIAGATSSAYRPAPPTIDRDATEILVRQAHDDLEVAATTVKGHGVSRVATHVVVDPNVAVAIGRFASDHRADLVAMSTHGRGLSRFFLGSVTNTVMRASGRAMLVCRPASVPTMNLGISNIEAQLPALSAF